MTGVQTCALPICEPLLDIHPDDAGPRSIIAGDTVRVFNDRGSVEMRAAVVDRVQPGLVTMPFGWWANATSVGRGANALTNPSLGRKVGSASFHDTLVQVEKAGS